MKSLAIYNNLHENLGSFRKYLNNIEEKFAEEIKGDEDFDELIIMGGPYGVYEKDRYEFLNREIDLIKKAYRGNKRVLGVCLGSQLIAEALGGKVTKGAFGNEVGIQKVYLLNEFRTLFGSNEIITFQWHGDAFSLPKDALLLAYSDKYFQAFRVGRILAILFHVEVNSSMVKEWVKTYGDNNQIIEDVIKYEKELENNSEKIIKYWLSL